MRKTYGRKIIAKKKYRVGQFITQTILFLLGCLIGQTLISGIYHMINCI